MCSRRLKFVRVVPRSVDIPERRTYECAACRVVFTEEATDPAPAPERVCSLNYEAGLASTRQ
jgi:hypothetical protein